MTRDVKQNDFIFGFDYLRILLCVGVIALHSNIFSVANQYIGTALDNPLYYRVLLYNFFWVCVPVFMTISLFLYVRKSYNDKNYFKKRIKQLIITYLFWAIIELVLNNHGNISFIKELDLKGLFFIFISNGTIAYFLFNLLYMTIFTEVIIRIYKKYNCKILYIVFFILSLILMFFNIYCIHKIGFSLEFAERLVFSNPLLFIPYSFSALFLYHLQKNKDNNMYKKTMIVALAIWILLGFADWIIRGYNFDFIKYNYESLGRPSLVFESIFLVLLFSLIKKKPNKIISKLSGLTMGVFLIHTIVLNYLGLNLINFGLNLNGFWIFILTTLISFLITYVIKKFKFLM